MISVTEKAEQKLHSLLKGKEPANLRVVFGPDGRIRLTIDQGPREPKDKNLAIGPFISVLDETSSLPIDTRIDVLGEDLVFNMAAGKNKN